METIREEDEEYSWREVNLPSSISLQTELEKDSGERRKTRDILIAVDHGPSSKEAFDWALINFCRPGDIIHLVHAVSSVQNLIVYDMSKGLMEKLAVQALQVAMVTSVARIVEGDAGKVICKEAKRLRPVAVIMGSRGRGLMRSVLQGSVGEYCLHRCKMAPVVIVPRREGGEETLSGSS